MKLQRPRRRKARIEMLPLIDIVFLLLVFFIYAMLSMAVHKGMPVDLPQSATAAVDRKLQIQVTVDAGGTVYIDRERVTLDTMVRALRAKMHGKEEQAGVLLFADRALSYQQLFRVLDQVKQAGITKISLQAEADGPP